MRTIATLVLIAASSYINASNPCESHVYSEIRRLSLTYDGKSKRKTISTTLDNRCHVIVSSWYGYFFGHCCIRGRNTIYNLAQARSSFFLLLEAYKRQEQAREELFYQSLPVMKAPHNCQEETKAFLLPEARQKECSQEAAASAQDTTPDVLLTKAKRRRLRKKELMLHNTL